MRIDPSRMNQRITIQVNTPGSVDAYGVYPASWDTYTTAWAQIEIISGMKAAFAQQNTADVVYEIGMLYQSGVTPHMRVLYSHASASHILEIEKVENVGFGDNYLVLTCRESPVTVGA